MKFISVSDQLPPDDSLVWIKIRAGWIIIGCTHTEFDGGWCWAQATEPPVFNPGDGKWFADCEIEDLDVAEWAPFPK